MKAIGVPTETKTGEMRVALTPAHAHELVLNHIPVHIQAGAGEAADFEDEAYRAAGCIIHPTAQSLYAAAELIVKVKEPVEEDLKHLKAYHTLFCFLHLAGNPELTETLRTLGLDAYAYETLTTNSTTPLLAPMSKIAGRLAVQIGSSLLHSHHGGRGVLLGGLGATKQQMNREENGTVTIIGAGKAGRAAARLASCMGAYVNILDIHPAPLNILSKRENFRPINMVEEPDALAEILQETDLLIGSVYVNGKKTPKIITEQQIDNMPEGAVAVDIAIDQGGCFETSKPCTHQNPTYTKHGIIHCAITNLPAAVPHTASIALADATLPYIQDLAQENITPELQTALNIQEREIKSSL